MPNILVIQHVPHEGLGTFEPAFKAAGLAVTRLDATNPKADWAAAAAAEGLVVMGGPQSVYEQATYPYLKRELEVLRQAVKAGMPVLGMCLGAQLLAAALGGKVTKNASKEIGWHPLMREPAADTDPLAEPFGQTESVFQWHGDTFSLPKGAVQLFSSPLCPQQAFRYGDRAYGLQFHVEVTEAMIRLWIQKNAKELASLRGQVDPAAIRAQNAQHLPRLAALSRHVAATFAGLVRPSATPTGRIAHARR